VDDRGAVRLGGQATNPGGTERLHEYWAHGEGAKKIRWGEGGDYDRCVLHLSKYVKDAHGLCANLHHDALGIWPATHAAMEHKAGRSQMTATTNAPGVTGDRPAGRAEFLRIYPLEDMHIMRSADGGDGRTVEAFAAVFEQEAEIKDFEGHYIEVIDRAAFNRRLEHIERQRGGLSNIKVLYNHGQTIQGTPSDRFSMPIGVPVVIRAEARGLLTRTRYSETPLADEVLENIRAGTITAQSFVGPIMRSDPGLRRGDRYRPAGGQLPTIRRMELGLRDYGPVVFPAYSGAEILGVRMSVPGSLHDGIDELGELDPGTPPNDGPAPGDPPAPEGDEHSARYHQHALYALRSKEQRAAAGLVW
jgi:HK97 family phage prohead protease